MSKKKVKNVPEEELKSVTGGYVALDDPINDPAELVNPGEPIDHTENKCTQCGGVIRFQNKSPVLYLCSICYQSDNNINPT